MLPWLLLLAQVSVQAPLAGDVEPATDAVRILPRPIRYLNEREIFHASDAEPYDGLGDSIAISGNRAVVCAATAENPAGDHRAGAAYVLERTPGGVPEWEEVAILYGTPTDASDYFGMKCDIHEDTVLVATDEHNPFRGRVFVFERDQGGPGAWGQATILDSGDPPDNGFGISVAIHGDTAVVGAPFAEVGGVIAGAVYVFERDAGGPGAWGRTARIVGDQPQDWSWLGSSVDIDGDTIVAGSRNRQYANPIYSEGALFVFDRHSGGPSAWGQVAELVADNPGPEDWLGYDVAIDGDTIVGSAPRAFVDGTWYVGAGWVFERDPAGTWQRVAKLEPPDVQVQSYCGYGVSIDGNRIALAASGLDVNGMTDAGAVFIYGRDVGPSGTWRPFAVLSASDKEPNQSFGVRVALGNGRLLTPNVAHPGAGVYAGAVYVFDSLCDEVETYCTAGTTTNGCRATLDSHLFPSLTEPGFEVRVSGAEGDRVGMFFYGVQGRFAVPWGTGPAASGSWICVHPPLQRTGIGRTSGAPGSCDGSRALALIDHVASNPTALGAPFSSGDLVNVQFWFRDPTSPNATHLSDALEFVVCP